MAIRITCPGCKTSLTLDDDKRGQKVRCDNCDKTLNIPVASTAKREHEVASRNGQKATVKAKSAAETIADDEDDAPRKSKKKKKQHSGPDLTLWLVVGGVVVFLFALGGGGWAIYKSQKDAPPPVPEGPALVARPAEKEEHRSGTRIVVPSREEGNPANLKKGGSAIINNVRGSAWRTERRNELRSIGQYYVQFAEDYKGANRNMMNFKEYIKTAPHTIREPVADGYYVMNFKADPTRDSQCIVAYERDEDNQGFKGHFVVKGDASVDYMPTAELKAALGN